MALSYPSPMDGMDLAALTRRPGPGVHRAVVQVEGRPVETLADLPPLRNKLLFVGLNPSPESVAAGHYHQGRLGRAFWARLVAASILPQGTAPDAADDALLAAGHGITDLLKVPSSRDEASDVELRAGVGPLWQKIAIWRPAATVFISKRAAEIAAGRLLTEKWGHLKDVALGARPCFLMPAPYAPRQEVDEGLNYLRNLGAALPAE
jgi:double-stranded uracil-DNA glycosylase